MPQLTNAEKRQCFNQMIAAAEAAGKLESVTNLELAREYFTNPTFKIALEAYVWKLVESVQ